MNRWKKTKRSKWRSGKDGIYWENFNNILHSDVKIYFFSYFLNLKSAYSDAKEDGRWPHTEFFFFGKSILIVLIKLIDDEVVEETTERDQLYNLF